MSLICNPYNFFFKYYFCQIFGKISFTVPRHPFTAWVEKDNVDGNIVTIITTIRQQIKEINVVGA